MDNMMSGQLDYFAAFNIPADASAREISKLIRPYVFHCHPNKSAGDEIHIEGVTFERVGDQIKLSEGVFCTYGDILYVYQHLGNEAGLAEYRAAKDAKEDFLDVSDKDGLIRPAEREARVAQVSDILEHLIQVEAQRSEVFSLVFSKQSECKRKLDLKSLLPLLLEGWEGSYHALIEEEWFGESILFGNFNPVDYATMLVACGQNDTLVRERLNLLLKYMSDNEVLVNAVSDGYLAVADLLPAIVQYRSYRKDQYNSEVPASQRGSIQLEPHLLCVLSDEAWKSHLDDITKDYQKGFYSETAQALKTDGFLHWSDFKAWAAELAEERFQSWLVDRTDYTRWTTGDDHRLFRARKGNFHSVTKLDPTPTYIPEFAVMHKHVYDLPKVGTIQKGMFSGSTPKKIQLICKTLLRCKELQEELAKLRLSDEARRHLINLMREMDIFGIHRQHKYFTTAPANILVERAASLLLENPLLLWYTLKDISFAFDVDTSRPGRVSTEKMPCWRDSFFLFSSFYHPILAPNASTVALGGVAASKHESACKILASLLVQKGVDKHYGQLTEDMQRIDYIESVKAAMDVILSTDYALDSRTGSSALVVSSEEQAALHIRAQELVGIIDRHMGEMVLKKTSFNIGAPLIQAASFAYEGSDCGGYFDMGVRLDLGDRLKRAVTEIAAKEQRPLRFKRSIFHPFRGEVSTPVKDMYRQSLPSSASTSALLLADRAIAGAVSAPRAGAGVPPGCELP